jgi:hypothetical protein
MTQPDLDVRSIKELVELESEIQMAKFIKRKLYNTQNELQPVITVDAKRSSHLTLICCI